MGAAIKETNASLDRLFLRLVFIQNHLYPTLLDLKINARFAPLL